MLAGFERRQGEFIMAMNRGRYRDRVDPGVLQDVAKLAGHANLGMTSPNQRQFFGVEVGNRDEPRSLGIGKITYQVWTPIAVADDGDADSRWRPYLARVIHTRTPIFPSQLGFIAKSPSCSAFAQDRPHLVNSENFESAVTRRHSTLE